MATTARSFQEVLSLPAPAPDEVLAYGDEPLQFVELYRPEDPPKAVVGLIHGGCWRNAYAAGHVRPAADGLRQAGYLVCSIEYRRLGDPGGGWPGTFVDIGGAVDRLQALDSADVPLVLAGHSAGGQLALWAAARAGFTPGHPLGAAAPLRPDGVLGLAAITDLALYAGGTSSCERAVPELLDGTPAERPDRYAAASPRALLPLGVPVALVQGLSDSIVPGVQAERFLAAALEAGDRVRLRFVPDAGHFDLIYPGSVAWHTALATLRELTWR